MLLFIDAYVAGGISILGFTLLTNPKKANRLGNIWLSILFFLVAIILFDKGLIDSNYYENCKLYTGIGDVFLLFVPPTLYLCVDYFVSLNTTLNKKDVWHFIVPIVVLIFYIFIIVTGHEHKIDITELLSKIQNIIGLIFIVSIFVYWLLSYLKIKKHQLQIQLFAAETTKIDLNWLKNFLFGIAGMALVFLAEFFISNTLVYKLASIGYLIGTFYLSYYTLRQTEVFEFENKEREEIKELIEEETIPEKQERLSELDLIPLKERLIALMQTEKLHLDESLNLLKLAKKMEVSTHDLSYVLNYGFGVRFFQFINTYRVEEAKQLLLSDKNDHLNMLGIAYSSGFNSKTTFNTTFKKITNLSPSEYQKAYKNKN